MSYIGLGSRFLIATKDTTGLNANNYTNAFTPAILSLNVPYAEIYKMVVQNVPIGNAANIVVNGKQWGYTQPFTGSEWDPAQPLLLNPGDELDFLWNIPSSGSQAPQATVWLRYDPSIPANARVAPGALCLAHGRIS